MSFVTRTRASNHLPVVWGLLIATASLLQFVEAVRAQETERPSLVDSDWCIQYPSDGRGPDGRWITLPPPPFALGAFIFDSLRNRILAFGGLNDGPSDETWALSFDNPSGWFPIATAGNPPSARFGHTAIYEPLQDQMVVFGGTDGVLDFNDVWTLDLSSAPAWTQIPILGDSPPARYDHTAILEPVGERMVIFGGIDQSSSLGDAWTLSLVPGSRGVWTSVGEAAPSPRQRSDQTAAYVPFTRSMLVFGGDDGSEYMNDLWGLSFQEEPSWFTITPAVTPLEARAGHAAAYDKRRDRLVVVGGCDGQTCFQDTWQFSVPYRKWFRLFPSDEPPPARAWHGAIYNVDKDQIIVLSGNRDGTGADARILQFPRFNPVTCPEKAESSQGPVSTAPAWLSAPNPNVPPVALRLVLQEPADVRLDLFDSAGRHVRTLLDGALPSGTHAVSWDGMDATGRNLASGVFFARAEVGGTIVSSRFTLVK